MKIFFLFLKITGKKWTGEMEEKRTGVKNWCQFRFVIKVFKKPPERTGSYISMK